MGQAIAVREDGQFVFVVHVEDVAAIQGTGTLVVLQVPRIAGGVEISAANLVIDLVRVGVVNFKAEPMPILLAQANLEAVVAAGEDVGNLVHAAKAHIGPRLQASDRSRACRLQKLHGLPSGC